jgi:hypothetical protein
MLSFVYLDPELSFPRKKESSTFLIQLKVGFLGSRFHGNDIWSCRVSLI